MKYANIIVDISLEKLDKTFQYLVPEELNETLRPGMQVVIPFGNRKITGSGAHEADPQPLGESGSD